MSPDRLRKQSRKQLESLARHRGISNTRALRKDELVKALTSSSPKRRAAAAPAIAGRLVPDQLDVTAQDQHWLRVAWEIGRASLDRASAALGTEWHRAVAVLRVMEMTGNDESRGTPRVISEVELPAGPTSWYVRVEKPERPYRVSLGFRTRSGRFHQIIQSRSVVPARSDAPRRPNTKPAAHVDDAEGWPLDLYAGRCHFAVETKQQPAEVAKLIPLRPNGVAPAVSMPDVVPPSFPLHVDAELIVRGTTAADARVTLVGKPITVSSDGRFCQRVPLPAGRQVVPVVATAADRSQERTVVLALELSVRELEPRVFDEL